MTPPSWENDRKPLMAVLCRLDDACLRFEDAWKEGKHPRAEAFLEELPEDERAEFLHELLLLEWWYLLKRNESFYLDEYVKRFDRSGAVVEQAWRRWKELHPATSSWSTVLPHQGGSAPTTIQAPPPFTLPGYERIERIGRGGMGDVYRAYDPALKRLVAVKVVRPEYVSADAVDRFRREAEALARLQHPHIAQVHAWLESAPGPALVMEYVSGGNLQERLGGGALAVSDAIRLTAVLAQAVQAAHSAGIVHRDLKPGNVLMAPPVPGNAGTVAGGFPKVTDFGLARLVGGDGGQSAAGIIVGTPMYMSPEQAGGQTELVGPATDVWALGVILYRCLAGEEPFRGDSILETLEKIKILPPPKLAERLPGAPGELETIFLACLDKDPARRPTAAELAERLEELNRTLSEQRPLPAVKAKAASPSRGRFRLAAVYAAVFLLAFAVAVGVYHRPNSSGGAGQPTAMQVRIWRPGAEFQGLLQALPLSAGDEVQVRFWVGKGFHASLYLINAGGVLTPLERYAPEKADHEIVYPKPGHTAELQGPPGTEMILLVGRAAEPVSDDEVKRLWGEAAWPALGPSTVVRLRPDGVAFETERERDFGQRRARESPEDIIQRRLEQFRRRLEETYSGCEAMAFGHR